MLASLMQASFTAQGPKVKRHGTRSVAFLAAGMLVAATASALAQDYPARPITVVVPFSAGGPSDVVARIVTEHMAKTLGQSLVIENVGGAGGTLGLSLIHI